MNLYHLQYFHTLAQLEHYTKAANHLNITQPSLSYAISSLETELGVKLFEKSGRNVVMTKYGRAFYNDVDDILAKLDNSIKILKLAGNAEGTIDIGFLRTLGTDYIPWITSSFMAAYPEKQIHFNMFCDRPVSKELLHGLKDRKYDMVFCSRALEDDNIEYIPVTNQELVVIVPSNHVLSNKKEVDLIETIDYEIVSFRESSSLRQIIDGMYQTLGCTPHYTYEVEEDQVVAGLVAHGFGIAIVPYMYMLESLDVKILTLRSPSYHRNFYMATLKDVYHPPVIELFRNYVIKKALISGDYNPNS